MTRSHAHRHVVVVVALLASASLAGAQTVVTPPPNHYSPQQDVQLGEQAAKQVEQQLPILHDDLATSYVRRIGERLVRAIPPELQHPEFHYTFQVVDVSDINAFALPGGPMFVNRGMIQAAHDEGEIAGVMAHELSHVVLRHGTAQASQATKYQVGEVAGAVLGAIVGGVWGNVIAQGTRFGIGAAFLRFGREYEQQADIEGAHIMARAGYDPRDMANMFKTIEKTSGPGGPEWLSDHPDPGNRYEYIEQEAARLQVTNPVRDTQEFQRVEAHLQTLPPAPTTEQVSKGQATRGNASGPSTPPSGRVEAPSSSFRTYTEGDTFQVSVPSNWRELPDSSTVTFAPAGAYGKVNGQSVFTHGVQVGIARNETHDLQTATSELIQSLAQGNPNLSQPSGYEPITFANRQGLHAVMTNVSEATRQPETIEIFTTTMRDGNLFYVIGVAPAGAAGRYESVFSRIVSSIQLMN